MSLTSAQALENKLFAQIAELDIPGLGQRLFEKAQRTEKKIKGSWDKRISQPVDAERAYRAVLKLLRSESLTRRDYSLIAGALTLPIREHKNRKLIETNRVDIVLDHFRRQYATDSLSMLGLIQLLTAYFSIHSDPKQPIILENREKIRLFLKETHQYFFLKKNFEPSYASTLRNHSNLLSDLPCERYVGGFLSGRQSELSEIKAKLPIQPESWFFQELTVAIVRQVTTNKSDDKFKGQIIKLLSYLQEQNGGPSTRIADTYRDEAIQLLLNRYYQCANRSLHKELCEYAIHPNVWKSPNLRDANILSKWNNINKPVWQMVNGWVNRKNLRAFFEILSKRHGADKGRFNFWIKYVDQIEYTRFIFGGATSESRDSAVKKLLADEQGVSSRLDGAVRDLDAFIIQIRGHTFVEFSMKGNAAFLYKNGKLPFSISANRLTHEQLGRGNSSVERFLHQPNWPERLQRKLIEDFGVFPDKNHSTSRH